MRTTYVWHPQKRKMVRKDEYVPEPKGPMVMNDMAPYECKSGDMAGKWITSRSQHRAFLQRNNLVEVGNEIGAFLEFNGKSRDNPYAERRSDWRDHWERSARKRR